MATAQLWFESALLSDGWANSVSMDIADGCIARVQVDAAPAGRERHGIAIPGLCNVHSHAFQRAMAGLAEVRGPSRDTFWTWRQVMYRFLDRIDPDDMAAIAAQAFVEMLASGFTRVGEFHYVHNDPSGARYADEAAMAHAIVAAAQETGIGLTLLPVFYAHGGFGGAAPTAGQRRFLSDLDDFARLHAASLEATRILPDAVVGVAPHSLRAVMPEELAVVTQLAGPIHIHASEQVAEVEDCVAWSGRRPVEWLLDHANVDARWCLIHATHLVADEVGRLAKSGAVAGLCPLTEANLGDGIFPATDYAAAGGRFGIGTDSNILIDAARELELLEYAQRLTRRERNVLARNERQSTGRVLYNAALTGGAQALGVATSRLAVGAPADFVTLDSAHPSLAGRSGDALLDSWIFASQRAAVDGVWRRGRQVVRQGRHIDAHAIARRYGDVVQRLLTT